MAVNIFGEGIHISGTGGPGQRGQPGIGFKILDDEGNYDIDGKRMANVGFPEGHNDTVAKAYVDKDVNTIRTSLADTRIHLKGYQMKLSCVLLLLMTHYLVRVYIDKLVID